MWAATIICAFIGFVTGGPVGAILGAMIGMYIDRQQRRPAQRQQSWGERFQFQAQRERTQSAFFEATFVVMGKLAKADGRVTEQEIQLAAQLMDEMRLSPEMKRQAIDYFNRGKETDSEITQVLIDFRHMATSPALIQMFLELQLQAAFVDGELSDEELALLRQVCEILGVSRFTFELLLRRFQAQRDFYQHYRQHQQGQAYSPQQARDELREAYAVLDVDPDVDDAVLKKAYRKLMSQHHPDKLVSKGLPKEMLEVAKQKAQEIQAAYELIKKARKES